MRNFDKRYGADNYFTKLAPDQVAAYRQGLVSQFGLAPEDVQAPSSSGERRALYQPIRRVSAMRGTRFVSRKLRSSC